jgi:two-component system KDP operon response regulator KdpE
MTVPKIMIVDDDRTTTGLLQTLLEMDGFEVIAIPDGATALKKAHEEHPDAFLVDYHLTDGHGTNFVRQLRADSAFKLTPIIMASGLDYEEQAIEAGANRFMIKPFDPGDLVKALEILL